MTHLYAIAGTARAGKDTFATLFTECAEHAGLNVSRFAFANALKAELNPYLIERYGISAWTSDDMEKQIIRPDLVAWGRMRRKQTNGTHWIKTIEPNVNAYLNLGHCVLITDCRFNTHPGDEVGWVKSLGGKVIYVERIVDGVPLKGANEEEVKHDPALRAGANVIVSWPTFSSSNYLDRMRPYVQDVWSQLTK
jgi:hypothetical protein